MTRLPTGTVSLLMSDVVGSTQRWAKGGGEPERDLAWLEDTMRRDVVAAGGVVVKARGEGDSHFAAFDRPSSALASAASIQRCCAALADTPPIRIAVTMGEICPRDEDYVGVLVNQSARIRSAAHGGQILCTRPVADVGLPLDGLSARSLGSYRVRDISEEIELFQVCGDGLRASFPPLCTESTAATTMMAVVIVDMVGSSRNASIADLSSWQAPLYRLFRKTAADHDGRFVKFFGDGCVAAFTDPREAVAFARDLCARREFPFRAGVAAGLVEIVEGELTGVPFYEAGVASKNARAGEVEMTPVARALTGER